MSDEPSLPPLPAVSWDEHSQSFTNQLRKRVRAAPLRDGQANFNNSSDPAVFSSDDDPSLDNYTNGRRKRRYVGSWFQQQPASSDPACAEHVPVVPGAAGASAPPAQQPGAKKRTLTRQFDSGVFFGSDGAESDGIPEELAVTLPKSRLPAIEVKPHYRRAVGEAELAMREKIRAGVDRGDDVFDFYSMGLDEVSSETMAPLSQLICIPVSGQYVAFEEKEPELQIHLAANRLTRVPGALFDLTRLTVLSLRGNQLSELPSSIAKLTSLVELNVALNQLHFLPPELLELATREGGRLKRLTVHPNPFLRPSHEQLEDMLKDVAERTERLELGAPESLAAEKVHFASQYLARSPIQHRSSRDVTLSTFKIPAESSSPVAALLPTPLSKEPSVLGGRDSSKARARGGPLSLFELALQSCYRSDELPLMQQYLPEDLDHLRPFLGLAESQETSGGQYCSRCGVLLIVPPMEWIEWHRVGPALAWPLKPKTWPWGMRGEESSAEDEVAIPFLHRGCSEKCGPLDQ